MIFRRITQCRVCHSPNLEFVGSLGKMALSDFTLTPSAGSQYPIDLLYCSQCTLLQLKHNPPLDEIYKGNYWYNSHINKVVEGNLKGIVNQALTLINFGKDDFWIDIGANDGTLLRFLPIGIGIAIDPSDIFLRTRVLQPRKTIFIQDYFENISFGNKAKVITAIAVLYDLADPNKFIENVKTHLTPDGIFIAQLMTLATMIESNDVSNICHEHVEYYSYSSLQCLYERNGLEIYKVEKNEINGGSYRIFARHFQNGSINFNEKSYSLKDIKDFMNRIKLIKIQFLKFLSRTRKEGKKVYGYGASTKGNTILQYYGIRKGQIEGIIDTNPKKIGKYTVASGIPVVNWRARIKADYLWILPWGFLDYFRQNEKEWIQSGGKFVVSIPEFKIL